MRAQIDGEGIRLDRPVNGPLDVLIGGHRVWSFSTGRDGVRSGSGVFVAWPRQLAHRLDGHGDVRVVPHGGGEAIFAGEVRFGTSTEPLVLRDEHGNPLALDKGGRMQRTFDQYDEATRAELVDASHRVRVDLVEHCGLDVYLCYGGLLGAARTGRMIGHDSDLDLAFLSKYTHPLDIIAECRAAEHTMAARGWQVVRMSAANFKIWVPLPGGRRAGVDVFGSFHIGDHFHITGSLRGTLDRDALVPFGSIELEGVTFPAPADVPAFLTFTYGPGWPTPDPSFHFDHPPANVRRMGQWFRGTRTKLPFWQDFYKGPHRQLPPGPSPFARWAAERMQPHDRVVELGSGTGQDAIWFTQHGHQTVGSDYCGVARKVATTAAQEAGLRIGFRATNAESLYLSFVDALRVAHEPLPRHVYARGLLDAIRPGAREGVWRFCMVAGRRGGLTFLELSTDVDAVRAEIAAHGGVVVEDENEDGLTRLVVNWRKS
ncbi:MAG: class I SAM-dependent methyltransferase [Nocardioidaceae bacterium]|nr:class I SAM-dependent methyltransferase [Nocardioidaceae bacterium]